jgi:hypothetical protein
MNLVDLEAFAVEGDVDWGDGEFEFVDGSNGQVVALGLETGIIGDPGQSEALAFGGDPVGRSLVGVSLDITVGLFAVRVVGDSLEGLLLVSFIAGGAVRSSVAIIKKSIELLQSNQLKENQCWTKIAYLHWPLPSTLRTSDWLTMVISGALYSGL